MLKEKKWLLISIFSVAYLIFLALKLCGFFDYSAKYGIEYIKCNQLYENQLFLIDNDFNTTWGKTEKHYMGESCDFYLKKGINVSKIDIVNVLENEIPSAKIDIYFSEDGENWTHGTYREYRTNEITTTYEFHETQKIKCLRLQYSDEMGKWPITEIYMH